MGTRCNIAVLLKEEDRKRGKMTFDKSLIPVVYNERNRSAMPFQDVPYRPFDLSRVGEGQVLRIYCQFDGYTKRGVGETLLTHYGTYGKALNLMLGGHLENLMSYVDTNGTVRLGYQNWAMSGRDKAQGQRYVPQDRLINIEAADSTTLDGLYWYLFTDGKWHVHRLDVDHIQRRLPDDPEFKTLPFWVPLDEFIRRDLDERADELLRMLRRKSA